MDGPYVDAIPELAENIISKESAAFVDIIHTNGAFEPCVVCTECKWEKELSELSKVAHSQVGNNPSTGTHGLLPRRRQCSAWLHLWSGRDAWRFVNLSEADSLSSAVILQVCAVTPGQNTTLYTPSENLYSSAPRPAPRWRTATMR